MQPVLFTVMKDEGKVHGVDDQAPVRVVTNTGGSPDARLLWSNPTFSIRRYGALGTDILGASDALGYKAKCPAWLSVQISIDLISLFLPRR